MSSNTESISTIKKKITVKLSVYHDLKKKYNELLEEHEKLKKVNETNFKNGQENYEELLKLEDENKKMKSLIDRIYRDVDWHNNGYPDLSL